MVLLLDDFIFDLLPDDFFMEPLPDDEPVPIDEPFDEPLPVPIDEPLPELVDEPFILPLPEFMDEPFILPDCILPDREELLICPPCDPLPVEPLWVDAPFELPLVAWAIEADTMPTQRAMQSTIVFFITVVVELINQFGISSTTLN